MTPVRSSVLGFLGGAAAVGAAIVVLGVVGGLGAIALVLVPAVLHGASRAEMDGGRLSPAVAGVLAAVIVAFGFRLLRVVESSIDAPPEWDFQAFRVFGAMAARHLDFYRPESAWAVAGAVEHSDEFKTAILDVGFWYPPPAMLLFWPLGWLGTGVGAALWYATLVAEIVVASWLLWGLFLSHAGRAGAAVVAALVLLLRATHATVLTAQTNFLVLALVLLFWRDRERMRAGVWLGLGTLVKPFVILLLLEPLLRGRWRTLAAAAATGASAVLVALAAFGSASMTTYLRGEVAGRMPGWIFTEVENQSLLAGVLRWTHAAPPVAGGTLPPSYLVLAALSFLATVAVVRRLPPSLHELGIGLVMVWALLVYPATLHHYAVLLLAPLLWLWSRRAELPGGTAAIAGLWTVVYVLVGASHASGVLPALALCFCVLVALGLRAAAPRGAVV